MKQHIGLIGSGFSSIAAAAHLAKAGFKVTVFEKNNNLGGRARQFKTENGFTFDMGPSWYWMPDIIESFFTTFNKKTSDYFTLVPLDPQFEMVFQKNEIQVPFQFSQWNEWIEKIEKGSSISLQKFMTEAKFKYEVGMMDFVNKPCHSWVEFVDIKIAKSALKMDLLTNFRSYTQKFFKHPQLQALMEFPVIFLGASPKNIPALYSMMNYGGYELGTWYPLGGFAELVKAMVAIAEEQGVKFLTNHEVLSVDIKEKKIQTLHTNQGDYKVDAVIGGSDYAHTETLLPKEFRNYKDSYWEKKTFAPSCLIYYLGINEIIPNLTHHTLFFETDLDQHIESIYKNKKWPDDPLFYVCCPSKTDENVAPKGNENLFLLLPIANNLEDNEEVREVYLNQMLERIEKKTGVTNLKSKIIYKRSYCVTDFKNDYNAYGGNAYGLANTLNQTAVLKPSIRNKKIKNLWYTGQLTVPGPGVPPAIISGKIVANELKKNLAL